MAPPPVWGTGQPAGDLWGPALPPPDAFGSPAAAPPDAFGAVPPPEYAPAAPHEPFPGPVPPPPYINQAAPPVTAPPPTYGSPAAPPPPTYGNPAQPPPTYGNPAPPPQAAPSNAGPAAPHYGLPTAPSQHGGQPAPQLPPWELPRNEPWVVNDKKERRRSRRPLVIISAATALVVAVGGGVFFLLQSREENPVAPQFAAARVADDLFAVDPAAKFDTVNQAINDIQSVGDTIVAAGTEYGGIRSRARFIVSTNGGGSWQAGSIKTQDGSEPSGSAPKSLVGAAGAWLALSGSPNHMVVWTSRNGSAWTELNSSMSSFAEGDTVEQVTRTAGGYFAVGHSSKTGQDRPIAWTSPDGRTWERLEGSQLNLPVQDGSVAQLRMVSAFNGTLIAGGTVETQRVADNKERQVFVDGFWRSIDGGRGWQPVTVPQMGGSAGLARGLAVTTGGLFVLRQDAKDGHGIVLSSMDGSSWQQAGEISGPKGAVFQRFNGGDQGLAAFASAKDDLLIFRSTDGGNWRQAADLGPSRGRFVDAIAPSGSGAIVLGGARNGPDKDFYLNIVDGSGRQQEVDLDRVAGVVNVERSVRDVTSSSGLVIAVGSTMGDAAVWSSRDGANSWVRAKTDDLGGGGRQVLLDVTDGPNGRLAVGDDAGSPLLATSEDGDTWKRVRDKVFTEKKGTELRSSAAAQGQQGSVIAGSETKDGVQSAAVWHSEDAKTWVRADSDDLRGDGGAWRWMADVTTATPGFVAVGALADPSAPRGQMARPAAWTSADGKEWVVQKPPVPGGATHANLIRVVAKGTTTVALGVAYSSGTSFAYAVKSSDGGKTWTLADFPRQVVRGEAYGPAIKVVPTAKGFAAVGTSGSSADQNVVLLTSVDGSSWKAASPQATGLSGSGDQFILGLAEVGGTLTGVGATADSGGEHSTLWRIPVP